MQTLVDRHQKIVHRHFFFGHQRFEILDVLPEFGFGGLCREIGRELARQIGQVFEREILRVGVNKKIERVQHRHFDDEVNLDAQLGGFLRKRQTRQVVGLRVLLPVDEVLSRRHIHRIRQDARAAMRGRAQAHHLRSKIDPAVVLVVRYVV